MNTRAIAATIINDVITHHRSLSAVLEDPAKKLAHSSDGAHIKELCFGTLRWYYRLKAIAKCLLFKPIEKKNHDIFCLLLIGLYQLIYINTPEYAAVSETVSGAKALKKPWATGLLNKTLRRFIDEKERIIATVDRELSQRYAHPQWLLNKIKDAWPNDWKDILTANNCRAPMTLRINQQKTTREDYLALLKEKDIAANSIDELPFAVQLEEPTQTSALPKFKEGYCYVQDQAGQYAARLLDVKKGMRILDACAAPGSKTSLILETQPELEKLVAVDKDPIRLQKIKQNIERLQLPHQQLHLILADAAHTKQWWTGDPFDRILIDAPCSATGVIRRHPDIKLLRQEEDIQQQADQQIHLLNTLWPLLKKQGLALYSTCSVLPEENEKLIAKFLAKHNDAKSIPIELTHGIKLTHGHQILPTQNQMDGFYYALLVKN